MLVYVHFRKLRANPEHWNRKKYSKTRESLAKEAILAPFKYLGQKHCHFVEGMRASGQPTLKISARMTLTNCNTDKVE